MNKSGRKFSELFYNVVTYVGVMISLVIVTAEAFLFALDYFGRGRNLYLGLFTYLLLPGFLFFGLALIPIGVFWKKRRIEQGKPTFELRRFRIDLSLSHHRNALLIFIVGTSLLVLMTLVGSYKAFHYTESVQFCGTLCHQVMNPEHTAYTHSPHGRVKCVECHIGEGADWYVRSKVSGARQVLKTLTNTYERPIHTPVHSLRPAEETCKKCHWPGKFFTTVDFSRDYYLTEGESPKWHLRMLMNVGAGKGAAAGVHAHMNLDHDIYYAADDEARQKISWVKAVDKQGKETVYVTPDSPYKSQPPPDFKVRKMDCIDCHNRPTHQFRPPYRLLNEAMTAGDIPPDLPAIKEKGMKALSKKYATTSEARAGIRKTLEDFYAKEHPDVLAERQTDVEKAVLALQKMYGENFFPEMKVRWDTHVDNIGHLFSDGCFRCHGGEHRSADGGVITRDCNACHTIVEQGAEGAVAKNLDGLAFEHPVDIDEQWKESSCTDCHSGGPM